MPSMEKVRCIEAEIDVRQLPTMLPPDAASPSCRFPVKDTDFTFPDNPNLFFQVAAELAAKVLLRTR